MDYRLAFNTTDAPVLTSVDGHSLGGGEWGPVDADDEVAQQAVTDQTLIWKPEVGDQPRAEVTAALEQLDALTADDNEKQPSSEQTDDHSKTARPKRSTTRSRES